MNRLLLVPVLLFLAGCASNRPVTEPPATHPANPAAVQAAVDVREDVFAVDLAATVDVRDRRGGAAQAAVPIAAPASATTPAATLAATDPGVAAHLRSILAAYLAAGRLLAADATAGLAAPAGDLAGALAALVGTEVPGDPHFWHMRAGTLETIRTEAAALAAAGELHAARRAYGTLSDALSELLAATGTPAVDGAPVHRFVCGMFTEAPEGGVWLQDGDAPRNPYFGSRMPTCYSKKAVLPPPGAPPAPMPDAAETPDHGGHHRHDGAGDAPGGRP